VFLDLYDIDFLLVSDFIKYYLQFYFENNIRTNYFFHNICRYDRDDHGMQKKPKKNVVKIKMVAIKIYLSSWPS
jgi:hypothetical protein